MEVNGNYGNVPTTNEKSIYADDSKDADQMQIDFLTMLTAQLEYQDPMDPVENTEFTAQMAQFSSLSEQQKGNELLQELISSQNVNQLNQVVSYIGNQVVFEGNKTTSTNGQATTRFEMPEAGTAEISLYDQNGQYVDKVTRDFGKGDQSFQFNDETLADGQYTFSVSVLQEGGGVAAAKSYESGKVTGVVNGDDGVQLEVNGSSISLSNIHRVEQQTS